MLRKKKQYIVETYNDEKSMQKGINKMAGKGYEVDKTTTDSRTGCGRKIAGGLIFSRPKVYHTVTYKLPPDVKAESSRPLIPDDGDSDT